MAAASSPPAVLPWTLRGAAALASAQALVESVAVAGRSDLTPGLRAALVLCLALTWVLAWRVLRLSAGAALGLLLLEGTTVLAALGAVQASTVVRVAMGVTALAAAGLLLASLHAFPPPAPPPSRTS